jgi:Na+(H+)/acetate symporter ActP
MGGGYVLNVTTDGRIPFWLGALLAFSVVAIYVFFGGLRAIGWVAVMKGIFMAVIGLYIVNHVVMHFFGSMSAMFHQIAERSPAHLMFPGPKGFVKSVSNDVVDQQPRRVLHVASFVREFLQRARAEDYPPAGHLRSDLQPDCLVVHARRIRGHSGAEQYQA